MLKLLILDGFVHGDVFAVFLHIALTSLRENVQNRANSNVFGDRDVDNGANCRAFDSRFKNTANSSVFGPRQAQKHRCLQWFLPHRAYKHVNLKNLAISCGFCFPAYENTVNNGVSADAKLTIYIYLSIYIKTQGAHTSLIALQGHTCQ